LYSVFGFNGFTKFKFELTLFLKIFGDFGFSLI